MMPDLQVPLSRIEYVWTGPKNQRVHFVSHKTDVRNTMSPGMNKPGPNLAEASR